MLAGKAQERTCNTFPKKLLLLLLTARHVFLFRQFNCLHSNPSANKVRNNNVFRQKITQHTFNRLKKNRLEDCYEIKDDFADLTKTPHALSAFLQTFQAVYNTYFYVFLLHKIIDCNLK